MQMLRPVLLLTLWLAACGSMAGYAFQSPPSPTEYEAVVDRLFPQIARPGATTTWLRYTYTELGETQLAFHQTAEGNLEVELWSLPHAADSISAQLNRLAEERQALTVEQSATNIAVRHQTRTLHRSDAFAKLLGEGSRLSLSLRGDETLTLHGMTYGIVIKSPSRELSVTEQGPEQEPSRSAIVTWMQRVRAKARQTFDESRE